jgi:hypothetical protein
MKKLFITDEEILEENINPLYTYTDEDMLERYLKEVCIKRKFWKDTLTNIKYIVLNSDCDIIMNEIRLRKNIKSYESFKRNIGNYQYYQSKDKYERRMNRYDKRNENIKILLEVVKEKDEEIKELKDNKVDLDTIIEEKIKHKLNSVVINHTPSNSISNINMINHLRNTIISKNCMYSGIKL